eukprot:10512022-Lingulodinium_polyedra.AAC.1
MSRPCRGHFMNISWPYHGNVLAINAAISWCVAWPCRGQRVASVWPCRGQVMAMSWPRRGHDAAMSWPRRGHDVAMSWPCRCHFMS